MLPLNTNLTKISDLTTDQLENAVGMLKAISHPIRLSILSFLENGKELSVTEIRDLLNIEQSTTSHHLGILKDKGVLSSKRYGKNTYYYLRHKSLDKMVECICNCSIS